MIENMLRRKTYKNPLRYLYIIEKVSLNLVKNKETEIYIY